MLFLYALATVLVAIEPGSREIGPWIYTETVDPIDDRRAASAALDGDGAALAVGCEASGANSIYVGVAFKSTIQRGDASRRSLTYRIDTGPPVAEEWVYRGSVAYLPSGPAANAVIAKLKAGSQFAIRVSAESDGDRTAVFQLTRSGAALSAVQAVCDAAQLDQ